MEFQDQNETTETLISKLINNFYTCLFELRRAEIIQFDVIKSKYDLSQKE